MANYKNKLQTLHFHLISWTPCSAERPTEKEAAIDAELDIRWKVFKHFKILYVENGIIKFDVKNTCKHTLWICFLLFFFLAPIFSSGDERHVSETNLCTGRRSRQRMQCNITYRDETHVSRLITFHFWHFPCVSNTRNEWIHNGCISHIWRSYISPVRNSWNIVEDEKKRALVHFLGWPAVCQIKRHANV